MKLTLATHNLHKRDELIAIVGNSFEVDILPDDFPEIPETGATLRENALIKARSVHHVLGGAVLSDDTGLEVEALGGQPGVFTARYAGENATYHDNCNKLLNELDGVTNRKARFSTVIAFIDEKGTESTFMGSVEGSITEEFRGASGFGYDPVFEPIESDGLTFAEMSSSQKNQISHRARAMAAFLASVA
ncbi:MAG: RdgB/HAM1 family non-canonical purine NTP pyrophosphatase [bacterium]